MEDFSLDFGKLAYAKVEDLVKRVNFIERKKIDTYNSLNFAATDLQAGGESRSFLVEIEKDTDLSFSCVVSGIGLFETEVYLDGIFVFTGAGGGPHEFEARGVSAGVKTVLVSFNGSVSGMNLKISGSNIKHNKVGSKISYINNSGYDYLSVQSGGELSLNKAVGNELAVIDQNFPKVKSSGICAVGSLLAIFYTVWDDSLFFELYDGTLNKTLNKKCIKSDVGAFCVLERNGDIFLFYTQSKRVFVSIGVNVGGGYVFSSGASLGFSNATDLQALSDENRIYMTVCDLLKNIKLVHTARLLGAKSGGFSFNIDFDYGGVL